MDNTSEWERRLNELAAESEYNYPSPPPRRTGKKPKAQDEMKQALCDAFNQSMHALPEEEWKKRMKLLAYASRVRTNKRGEVISADVVPINKEKPAR